MFVDPVLTLGMAVLWASFAFVALAILVLASRRPLRLWLAVILLSNFSLGGASWFICNDYCRSLGGYARGGGMDEHGVYHLKNRRIDTPVTPSVYWRADRIERLGDRLSLIGVGSLIVLIAWAFVAERVRKGRTSQAPDGEGS